MSGAWLTRAEGGEAVPVDEEALPGLVRAGRITASTPLWRSGAPEAGAAGSVLPRLFAQPPPYTGPRAGWWADAPPRPWRRFLARAFDVGVVGDSLFAVLSLFAPALLPVEQAEATRFFTTVPGALAELVAATLLVVPANALSMAKFGTTLGKSLFGVRVTQDGTRPSLRTALRREGWVWLRGQALGLPLVQIVANADAYLRLKRTGTTPWDEALGLRVSYRPLSRVRMGWLAAFALLLAALTALSYLL